VISFLSNHSIVIAVAAIVSVRLYYYWKNWNRDNDG